MKLAIFWFRRDLRLEDNVALYHAISSDVPVLPIFIFDENILDELPADDQRITFIHSTLHSIHKQLLIRGSSVLCLKGDPVKIWEKLIAEFNIKTVYISRDYEPYATNRDQKISMLLARNNILLEAFKGQVIFEPHEILKTDGTPYTIYTPYKNKWLSSFNSVSIDDFSSINYDNFYKVQYAFPSLNKIGFEPSKKKVKDFDMTQLHDYDSMRNFPHKETSCLGPHLRFGTVSIRWIISQVSPEYELFLNELIWREFFAQILFNFPNVVKGSFKSKYDKIHWRNDESEFDSWCKGKTGYPLVDAGMRELNKTGYMHNRVRMITASFLCKHLLIDWRWGESYFAQYLIDYDLSSNNGNWQWAASTGCDVTPYFRVFNPSEQLRKFDKELKYVKKWIPEYGTKEYPDPIVDHKAARIRALETYKAGLNPV